MNPHPASTAQPPSSIGDDYESFDKLSLAHFCAQLPHRTPAVLLTDVASAPIPCHLIDGGQALRLDEVPADAPATATRAVLLMHTSAGRYLLSGGALPFVKGDATVALGPFTHAIRMQSRASRRLQLPSRSQEFVLRCANGEALALKDVSEGGCALHQPPLQCPLAPGDRLTLLAGHEPLPFVLDRVAYRGPNNLTVGLAWKPAEAGTMNAFRRLLNQLEVRLRSPLWSA